MTSAETLLDRKARVCGTMRANRGIPPDLGQEAKHLEKGQSVFQRKGDVIIQVWKEKRLVRMIRIMCDETIMNTRRTQKQTWK
jgi:hypothetical protein